MTRRAKKENLYRVKVKDKRSFRTALLTGRNPKKAAHKSMGGRILSVTKVSKEELLKVGEFFSLGDQLMREFKEEERRQQHEEEIEQTNQTKSKQEVLSG